MRGKVDAPYMRKILNYKKKTIIIVLIISAGVTFFALKKRSPAPELTAKGTNTRGAKLILAGPPAAVSFPLAYAVATGEFKDLDKDIEFKIWMNPDQLRTLAMSAAPAIVAMPSNVAANLYNRNIAVRPVNISTWGILYILSRDKNKTRLADFKNQEIAVPFRGDMPDIVLQILAKAQGFDVQRDFKFRYVATPFDALQLLLTRRVDNVLLPEPAVSMALRKAGSYPLKIIAPTLFRSVSLQKEWGNIFKRDASMPQAGIVAVGKATHDLALMNRINAGYTKALAVCKADPVKCGNTVAPYFDLLTAEAIADSMQSSQLNVVAIDKAQVELKDFYKKLFEAEPASIGGKMPAEDFYRPLQ